jgi:hypothetical protein
MPQAVASTRSDKEQIMVDLKLTGKPMDQRLSDRLRNSGGDLPADVKTQQGKGPQRVFHNIHHAGTAHGSTTKTPNANEKGGK